MKKPRSWERQPAWNKARGFTLVEMLTVLAIVAVLSVLSFPALSGLTSSGNVNNTVSGISLLLDEARAYAMAHNTYVWVGFAQNSSSQELTVGVVAGITGQSTDINSSSTYIPIAKVHNYNNFSLNSTISGLSGMNTSSYSDISSSTLTTFQQQQSAGVVKFTKVIQFNPQGEASIGANSAQCVQIGLQPEYGNNTNNSNVAVFQIETLTGQVQVFRK